MSEPLCIDLYCGLGGWTEGFLAEGWDVIGFDIERHVYGAHQYPAQLVLQDVLTVHGRQFKDAACIVASSPCQAYSYMAMPWTRAKQIAKALRGEGEFPDQYNGYRTIADLNALFEAPKRIQREASEAAGRFIPMIQENVRGAIPWVGRSAWNFGSYHLWGDVPALMPFTHRAHKVKGFRFDGSGASFQSAAVLQEGVKAGDRCIDAATGKWSTGWNVQNVRDMKRSEGTKNSGGSWFNIGSPGQKVVNQNPVHNAEAQKLRERERERERDVKGFTPHGQPLGKNQLSPHGSKSPARKQASAMIAQIPLALASHVARVYRPMVTA